MNIFIFGAGYSALTYIEYVASKGYKIAGTTRDKGRLPELLQAGVTPFLFDGKSDNREIKARLSDVTHLLISIAPPRDTQGGDTDPVLAIYGEVIRHTMPNLEWIGYLSTVGVYGNHDGVWVDESTPTAPVSNRSIQRESAEINWRALADTIKVPLSILRLSGIYGPNRNIFRTIEAGRARRLVKKGQMFNRIHVADIARAIDLAATARASGIFNITDNQPAPPQDLVTFAHELMDRQPPPELDFDTADITPMARSFYGENKQVSNARSKSELGMIYDYPDYRTSLKKMWEEGDW